MMTTERRVPAGGRVVGREPGSEPVRERILDATLVSLARYGVAKTTLEDVAKEAGCARATVYRYFGGKQQLLDAAIAHECGRVLAAIDAAVVPGASVEDALVAMATTAAHEVLEHDALQFVLAHEPELILPWITFDGCRPVPCLNRSRTRADIREAPPCVRGEPLGAVVHPDLPGVPRG